MGLTAHFALTRPVGFLEPTELCMSEFLVHQVGKQRNHPSDQTTLRTSLQVKDVNKILLW